MSDEKPRGRGRPAKTGAKFGRLYVNVPTEIIAALTAEAEARGVSLSELTRTALADWMRNNPPTGVQTPVSVEQSAYQGDETNRSNQ
jgi:hypothetical protein